MNTSGGEVAACFACFAGILLLGLFVAAVFGLGWLVVQPLGRINHLRVTRPRFQLLDLFWIMILLQPSLWLFASLSAIPRYQHNLRWEIVTTIFALLWGGTVIAWAVVAGVLCEAGVTSSAKRAAAQLILVPMIGFINPFSIVFGVFLTMELLSPYGLPSWTLAVTLLIAPTVFIAALFGCRRVSRWIASGLTESTKDV